MKRVYCLYRVSTIGQVERDDIPMQRTACREFASSKNWEIVEEFIEKGVSGFRVSAKNREVMQHIKRDTILRKFDILLVFMFDRLGRCDDETPFVVEWFVKNGIEVWNVIEGEQRFENHVDKLMNYIRYWQSSGESLKTSIRVKTRQEQLIKEGRFRGGKVPYGYKLCKMGRVNKRNHEVNEIQIDEEKAAIVREIFSLYCCGKMGTHKIASLLTKKGICSSTESQWYSSSINNILKNKAYIGILKSGEAFSECIESLRIIDDIMFSQAQDMMIKNKMKKPKGITQNKLKDKILCADLLYCTHCEKKMSVSSSIKSYIRKDGTVKKTISV
jgi:DNA invertase Pin-like site-specific DNA recombinase